MRFGEGLGIGHAGELLQGVVHREGRRPAPFLVTLPAPHFVSRATVWESDKPADSIEPVWKSKALQAARKACDHISPRRCSFRIVIESRTPVGRGCGSSTTDCVAAIRAVGNFFGVRFAEKQIARWSAQAELASDSTMYNLQPVAFCQRDGLLFRPLGSTFPPLSVVAFDLGGPRVDTVSRQLPKYSASEIGAFHGLLESLQTSIERRDALGLAQVATESSAIHQKYFPHPGWTEFRAIADRAGALGVGCAHSGTVAFALMRPHALPTEERIIHNMSKRKVPTLIRYTLGEEHIGDL
jgi:uncharacterized protein involved in propanediol utilization